jgi:hypothetical protein
MKHLKRLAYGALIIASILTVAGIVMSLLTFPLMLFGIESDAIRGMLIIPVIFYMVGMVVERGND